PDIALRSDRAQIFARGLRRNARGPERPVKPIADPAADAQRSVVDGDLSDAELEALGGRGQRNVEVEPGAKRDLLDRPDPARAAAAELDRKAGARGHAARGGRGDQ